MYVMLGFCRLYACIVKISVSRRMLCTHVICAYSATCPELRLIVFMCVRGRVTICGLRERRNVYNDNSETFEMAL